MIRKSINNRSGNILRFPQAAGEPRRIGCANADVATGRGVLSLPRAAALRGLTDAGRRTGGSSAGVGHRT